MISSQDSGGWKEKWMTKEQFMTLLQNKIQSVSFNSIRNDIVRFIPDDKMIEIWSPQYLHCPQKNIHIGSTINFVSLNLTFIPNVRPFLWAFLKKVSCAFINCQTTLCV